MEDSRMHIRCWFAMRLMHWRNTSQIPRDKARIHQFGKKVLPGICLGYALIAGGIWKGDILVTVIDELEKLDASEVCPRRLNVKEVLITQKDGEFVFLVDGSATLSGRHCEFQEPTLRREHNVRRESVSGESQGEREEFEPEETKDEESRSKKRKTRMGNRETETRTRQRFERSLF